MKFIFRMSWAWRATRSRKKKKNISIWEHGDNICGSCLSSCDRGREKGVQGVGVGRLNRKIILLFIHFSIITISRSCENAQTQAQKLPRALKMSSSSCSSWKPTWKSHFPLFDPEQRQRNKGSSTVPNCVKAKKRKLLSDDVSLSLLTFMLFTARPQRVRSEEMCKRHPRQNTNTTHGMEKFFALPTSRRSPRWFVCDAVSRLDHPKASLIHFHPTLSTHHHVCQVYLLICI